MNKKVTLTVIAMITSILIYFYASPYLVLNQIKNAAETKDSAKISKYIDYDSVRQSLKSQLSQKISQTLQANDSDSFSQFTELFSATIVDKIVDTAVTPQGIALLLDGKDLKRTVEQLDLPFNSNQTATPQKNNVNSTVQPEYSAHYLSLNQFEVTINQASSDQFRVLMQREGLSWKIKQIFIPLNE